jgi:hypothetical protein
MRLYQLFESNTVHEAQKELMLHIQDLILTACPKAEVSKATRSRYGLYFGVQHPASLVQFQLRIEDVERDNARLNRHEVAIYIRSIPELNKASDRTYVYCTHFDRQPTGSMSDDEVVAMAATYVTREYKDL